MKRRATTGGKVGKARRRKTQAPCSAWLPIAVRRCNLREQLDQTRRERDEALEQQTATSEVLQGHLKFAGRFRAGVPSHARKCSCASATLISATCCCARETIFRIGATYGAPPAYVDYLRSEQVFQLNPTVGLGLLVKTKAVYRLADIAAAPNIG